LFFVPKNIVYILQIKIFPDREQPPKARLRFAPYTNGNGKLSSPPGALNGGQHQQQMLADSPATKALTLAVLDALGPSTGLCRERMREYLGRPRAWDCVLVVQHATVAQKSYGNEKRWVSSFLLYFFNSEKFV
jgi:hypothetical protein